MSLHAAESPSDVESQIPYIKISLDMALEVKEKKN